MASDSHSKGLQFPSKDETEPVSSGGKPVVPQGSSSNIEVAPSTTSTLPVTPKPTAATSAAAKAPAGCVTGGAAPAETTQSSLSSEHKMSATGLQSDESKAPNSLAPLEENSTSGKVIQHPPQTTDEAKNPHNDLSTPATNDAGPSNLGTNEALPSSRPLETS